MRTCLRWSETSLLYDYAVGLIRYALKRRETFKSNQIKSNLFQADETNIENKHTEKNTENTMKTIALRDRKLRQLHCSSQLRAVVSDSYRIDTVFLCLCFYAFVFYFVLYW